MIEAIELIEKQILEVRNKIQGTRNRVDNFTANIKSDEKIIDDLLKRESFLMAAVNRLRE